ncbi:hypothetical protein B0J13DRAFT_564436 [Dactylonectria estremocensis]|uniref:Uncharacterized protein n=1 Tax=Dactylonectria estremocensis TaxID=1079267 RepID=A0A9P9E2Y1_9HYPO|nr:hypothetical protein B0J13DRAFT_564436 [Dactylonectria estremocensis]
MAGIFEMIDLVWRPPRGKPMVKRPRVNRHLPENFKYYGNWGFTIYRTYYGPESNEHWDMLLDALKRQTNLAFGYYEDKDYADEVKRQKGRGVASHLGFYENQDEYRDDLKRLKKLFRLDTREDPSLLGGLDIRQLREVCLNEQPETERTMAGRLFRFVLVADEAVLKDIAKGEFVVKTVGYDWEERGEYWGWMRIPTGYLLQLWHSLILWRFTPYRFLRFDGPEEDLEEYIWPGDFVADPTGDCSEVRRGDHYSAQSPLFKIERNKE